MLHPVYPGVWLCVKVYGPSDTAGPEASGDYADVDSSYSLLYGNNNWYLLLRLFYILCDRLSYFYAHMQSAVAAASDTQLKPDSVETAYALCLKTPRQ